MPAIGRFSSTFTVNGGTVPASSAPCAHIINTTSILTPAYRQAQSGEIRDHGMTKQTIELDMRRGMAAQKATELRRLMSEVAANEELLRSRQKELEEQLLASPSMTWQEAADKARYLLSLFASSPAAQDPRRQMLIARVLEDFMRLSTSEDNLTQRTPPIRPIEKGSPLAGPRPRQQHRPGAPRSEKENATRRRVSRDEAAQFVRKALRAEKPRKVRGDPPGAEARAQEGAARRNSSPIRRRSCWRPRRRSDSGRAALGPAIAAAWVAAAAGHGGRSRASFGGNISRSFPPPSKSGAATSGGWWRPDSISIAL